MKDVAILTKFYKNYNYGGMLQGYALHRVIEEMGKSCNIVSYDVAQNPNPVYSNLLQQFKQYGASAAVNKVVEKAVGKLKFFIRNPLRQRKELFNDFMKDVDADTELYADAFLDKLNDEYTVFVSGSDQIWNPNAVRNLYLQKFVAENKRKVAYAASMGRNVLSEYEADKLIPFIKRFDFIGVREKTAKRILENYSIDNINIVIDPTLLLSASQWDTIAAPRAVKQKYALFYFFSDSFAIRRELENFCKEKNLIPVIIPYAKQEFNFGDGRGKCIRLNHVGPREFISAIKYADYVFTDSFHGAVFSIIHHKQFVVFERNKAGHVSMNSRLYDLLDLFDLSDRLVGLDKIKDVWNMKDIDYIALDIILNELKCQSLEYLRNALGVERDD